MPSVTELAARAESMASSRRVRIALLIVLCIYGARFAKGSMGDFRVYRLAAERAVAGESVYRLSDEHRYLYAPVVTFLFLPLAAVPPLVGKLLWVAFNFFLLVSIFRSTALLLFPEGRAPPGFYALVLLLSFRFIDNNLGHGQINIFMLWLVLQAYVLATRERHAIAGLALAAAIGTKLVPIVFLVQLVLRRQWRFALWTLAGGVGLMVVPFLWWGSHYPAVVHDWVAVVVDQAGHYDMENKINQSISAFAFRLFRPYEGGRPLVELAPVVVDAITAGIHLLFIVPLVALSLRLRSLRRTEPQGPEGDELALYLLYSTVASPYSWKYYFINFIFPIGVAARRLWTEPADRTYAYGLTGVFLLNLLAGLELLGKRVSTLFQLWSFHFLAVALLFVVLTRAAYRRSFTSSGTVC